MAASSILKRLLDTGMQFTDMSQKSAEKLVGEFVKSGQLRRKDAEKAVEALMERGRSSSEHLIGLVQAEVAKQLARFAQQVDALESRLEELARSVAASPVEPQTPAKKAPAKKAPAKKAPAKSSKPAAGSSGVAKITATTAAKR